MQIKKIDPKGKTARLRNVTLDNMSNFSRDSFVYNSDIFVSPDDLSMYFPENKRFLKKCPGCGRYASKLSILVNFPPLCKDCIGELWYYSNLATDPFDLKRKRILNEKDCAKIVSYIQTLRVTSKAARTSTWVAIAKLFLGEDKE